MSGIASAVAPAAAFTHPQAENKLHVRCCRRFEKATLSSGSSKPCDSNKWQPCHVGNAHCMVYAHGKSTHATEHVDAAFEVGHRYVVQPDPCAVGTPTALLSSQLLPSFMRQLAINKTCCASVADIHGSYREPGPAQCKDAPHDGTALGMFSVSTAL